ncbi:MAG: methyltransferase domain-containing protein, partial [Rickettsiales bacterium]|nr:methyltransferase domain-containing protein [Rickettsiales bacterium]
GEGRNAVFLASQGFSVSAIDQSEVGQQKAKKLAEQENVTFAYDVVDISDYDMGHDKWDGIVAIFAHTEPDVRQKMIQGAKDGLKIGGVFLLEGYNKEQLTYGSGGPKEHYKMFSLAELKDAFNDFIIIKAENTIRDIHEGEYHDGTSSVVQFIAKK